MPATSETFVRRASPSDVPVLRAILYDTFESTWLPELTPAAAQRYRDEDRPTAYIRERSAEFRVAEYDGLVVGFVGWRADFVNALHVHSSHANRGVGSRLMDLAENEIASAGFRNARLETDTFNSRSRAFYAKRGYREADRYPDIEWDSGLTTLLLLKSLGRAGRPDARSEHTSQ